MQRIDPWLRGRAGSDGNDAWQSDELARQRILGRGVGHALDAQRDLVARHVAVLQEEIAREFVGDPRADGLQRLLLARPAIENTDLFVYLLSSWAFHTDISEIVSRW